MDLSPEKLFLLGLIALVVLGPERLPQAARTAGRALSELRRLSAAVQHEISGGLAAPLHLPNADEVADALRPRGHAAPSPAPKAEAVPVFSPRAEVITSPASGDEVPTAPGPRPEVMVLPASPDDAQGVRR